MFRRRVPKKVGAKLQDMIWPKIGWLRAVRYWIHRVFRNKDSTHKITAGLASGDAVSFSPFIGTHILQSFFLAKILKVSWIAALVGTVWGNPWTFPFLFAASYITGAWLLHAFGIEAIRTLPDYLDLEYLVDQPKEFFAYLFAHPLELLLPMTIGSLVAGTLFWLVAYGLLYYPVRYARTAYNAYHDTLRERFRKLGKIKKFKEKLKRK